ncbi:MAG: DUF86 domain-containing protein [Deltaproteobacteria bacterium]|nr:DUF86 domain-containing protein [Deltaproteobacteria bacterium]
MNPARVEAVKSIKNAVANKAFCKASRKGQRQTCPTIEMIGSAASRISREYQNGCKPIPWDQIIEMKQQVVHTYWEIDRDWIWEKMEKDIPALSKALEIFLSAEE